MDRPAAAAMLSHINRLFGWTGPAPTVEAARHASYVVNGLITVCDWLGSDQAFAFQAETPEPEHYFRKIALPTAR